MLLYDLTKLTVASNTKIRRIRRIDLTKTQDIFTTFAHKTRMNFLLRFVLYVARIMTIHQDIELLIDALRKQRTLKGVIAKESAIQRYISIVGDTPVIESTRAHFFYEHDGTIDVSVVGDWNNWNNGIDKLQRIHSKSSLYHLAKDFPLDARLSYRFVINNNESINDPNNTRTWQEVFGNNSYFTMPSYRGTKYLDTPKANVPIGELREFTALGARGMDFERKVFIYIPEKLKRNAKYHFIYVHDGEEAIRIGKFTNVLDNLRHYEPSIPNVIAVFIPPVDRHKEYLLNPHFAKWCATSLVKQVEKLLGVRSEARMRCVQGASLGGLCATYTGFLYPKVFGNIGAQSPSFWVEDHRIIEEFKKKRRLPLRFFLHTGTIHDALTESHQMLAVLHAKKYDVTYLETSESHNWANWSVRYEDIVRWFA
jgi:enterochelin esterase-like enzyme